ncbi:MAG TPA: glycoside hydrolase domain-containing protein [Streptosporangiaceae bacterium]|nr:glycoside hydrolase domain-containing protein [Streptosporangiaceae bacterium]
MAAGLAAAGLVVSASGPAAASPAAAGTRVSGTASVRAAGPARTAGHARAAGAARTTGAARTEAAAAAPARAGAALRRVQFQGYTFQVPAAWPVIDLARHPATCVRYDRHAVYLGSPGADQSCPSWLFGTTEAVLVQAGPAAARRSSQENPVSRRITVTAPRIRVTATFSTNPNVLYRMLSLAGLPAPQITPPNPAVADSAAAGSAGGSASQDGQAAALSQGSRPLPGRFIQVGPPELPASVANYRGRGFDSCAAPSPRTMRAWWRHSPYGAVGIYIGGSDRACDQVNLSQAWVRREAARGWRFFPMYAGPQAAFGELRSPKAQGARAAADAVVDARALGFGPRTPIYYDMEAYPARRTGAALRFLSAWTKGLHRLNYRSGVYSSSRSGIIDLARQYGKHAYAMPDAIYDALWNGSANVSDSVYGKKAWPRTHRMHQYSGNDTQTFGGHTLDIDKDYLSIRLAAPGGTMQSSAAAESAAVFYEGRNHHLWRKPRAASGTWGPAVDMGGDLGSQPSAVRVGASGLDVFYRGRSGALWLVKRTSRGWQRGRKIGLMGDLGSGPRAVSAPNGVIDVFWKGSHDPHLWHGQYNPGHGWSGPQRLGGNLAGPPAPVENRYGGVQVFWEGRSGKHSLWRVQRRLGGSWTRPQSLGMGPLGGSPRATALPSGAVEVVWRGSTRPHHVWSAFLRPGHRPEGPRSLGGRITGSPWPVAADSTARVFFRGTDHRLWQLTYRNSGRWHQPARLHMGKLGDAPFAAAGRGWGSFQVFWKGRSGGLWTVSGAGRTWRGPKRLGGRLH